MNHGIMAAFCRMMSDSLLSRYEISCFLGSNFRFYTGQRKVESLTESFLLVIFSAIPLFVRLPTNGSSPIVPK
ncbi:hypothetical protein EV363DRAFT_1173877 [Boletus edulis]|uniref:Uncharacterized protein n=1 Tax=Boletus edulis BED1 TaxID=1328754 RepID=A0AAD4C955_BOLED|nr:hypothetical protein EV363DRAFT_1173877 [Boletus edulis]KAF8452745.1 hypothetical protein L210DRAFT_570981 [Boletus edulis BED1]